MTSDTLTSRGGLSLFVRYLRNSGVVRLKRPKGIVLGIDTMVMDNEEAEKRHGVQPTYRKVNGFQPLQMTWERYVVDAVFRGGKKHGNHGQTVSQMVRHMVHKIRKHYRRGVPIVVRMDSGFFDEKLFDVFDELRIGYECTGKLYEDLKAYVQQADVRWWGRYHNREQAWDYLEFGDRRGSWSRFFRVIFCRPVYEDQQMLLSSARPETILYTTSAWGTR